MKTTYAKNKRGIAVITTILVASALASCGGSGQSPGQLGGAQPTTPIPNPNNPPTSPGLPPSNPGTIPQEPNAAVPTVGQPVTAVTLTGASATQTNVPMTFGQLFRAGDLKVMEGLVGKLTDGTSIPLQVDVKTTHEDGSIRHAIISAVVPTMTAQSVTMELIKTDAPSTTSSVTAQSLLDKGFKASARITLGGVTYTADAEKELKDTTKQWLAGSTATEWVFGAPLKDSAGNPHPHLHVRYAIRYYPGQDKARVDFTLENNWAYEAGPQNFTYDAQLSVGGTQVYSKTGLTHYHHARWRKIFWWGGEPQVHIAHQPRYLINTKALPYYDPSVVISANALTALKNKFTGEVTEPMKSGMAVPGMPGPGGRPDIGLQPGWVVSYLLSMDKDAKRAALGTADLSGSWSHHYRDKNTDKPIDLFDYPYMTILGHRGDTKNPRTGQYEQFPACGGTCTNPNTYDISHSPNFAFVPYIVTGDYYYLEEIQFAGMYNSFASNPGYRKNILGLVSPDQVRGQAWALRLIGEAGYISPDNDPLKAHFKEIIRTNMAWYDTNYTTNTGDNAKMGALTHGYAVVYNSDRGLAPWQDDFFTSSIGHLVDLGYNDAKPLLNWKAQFPVGRMTADGFCWILGANYTLNVKDAVGAFYTTWTDIYKGSMPSDVYASECGSSQMGAILETQAGAMPGYPSSNQGFPSNMQPALAYSVDAKVPGAAKAWSTFMSRTILPDYQNGAQFAIVPRPQ